MITCEPTQHIQYSTLSVAELAASSTPVKEDIHRNSFRGKTASIQRVANGGHLVPQVQPDSVADAILNTFSSLTTFAARSRL
jgi:hypothetical protein